MGKHFVAFAVSSLFVVPACGSSDDQGPPSDGNGMDGGQSSGGTGGLGSNGNGGERGGGTQTGGSAGAGAPSVGDGGNNRAAGTGASSGSSGTSGGTSGTSGDAGDASGSFGGTSADSGGTSGNSGGTSSGFGGMSGGSGGTSGGGGAPGGSAGASGSGGQGGRSGIPGQWYELGRSATNDGITAGSFGEHPEIELDVDGHPIVAWRSLSAAVSASLKHWNGTSWSSLGHSASDIGVARGTSDTRIGLATLDGGDPVVAWSLGPVLARRWGKRAWEPLGSSASQTGVSGVKADQVSMVSDHAGHLYVAYRVVGASNSQAQIQLKTWTGTTWTDLGGSTTSGGVSGTGAVQWPSVGVDDAGHAVVAWQRGADAANPSAIIVKRWNGASWDSLGSAAATGQQLTSPSIVVDATGHVTAAWLSFRGSPIYGNDVQVRSWNGASWEALGDAAGADGMTHTGKVNTFSLTVNDAGGAVVAWANGSGTTADILLRRWDGTAWIDLGGSGTLPGISATPTVQSESPAVATFGNRTCVTWTENVDHVHLRCFDEAPTLCGCDRAAACDSGCACDAKCLSPAFDDLVCPNGGFRCDDGKCVAASAPCNGTKDCSDGSDESKLCPGGALVNAPRASCPTQWGWACADGTCVDDGYHCDRIVDCDDGSDEDALCDSPTSWKDESTGLVDPLTAVWAGPSGVFADGFNGAVWHRTSAAWTRVDVGAADWDLGPVWGSGSSYVAVGFVSDLIAWNGTTWTPVTIGPNQTLTGIWGTSPTNVWVAGYTYTLGGTFTGATTWHGVNGAWTQVSPGVSTHLRAISGSSASDIWAVGDGGTILHSAGSTWSSVTSSTSTDVLGVWAITSGGAWAVGDDGLMLRWTGGPSWTVMPRITQATLRSVWARNESDIWAVGTAGTIVHWNGSAWSNVWSGTSMELASVYGYGTDVWAVGIEGTILHLAQ